VKALEPGEVFLDIGANSGLFSVLAGERLGRDGVIIAFEPQQHLFSVLAKNIESNGVTNVVLFNAAVVAQSGWYHMSARNDSHSGINVI
jgi:FkbM family methyltransferase